MSICMKRCTIRIEVGYTGKNATAYLTLSTETKNGRVASVRCAIGDDLLRMLDKLRQKSKLNFTEFADAVFVYYGTPDTLTERITATLNQALYFLRSQRNSR